VVILSTVPLVALKAFSAVPLLYYNYLPVSKFQDCTTKLILRKNTTPKFKDTEWKATFMPDLSEHIRRRYTLRQAILNKRRRCLHQLICYHIYSYGKLIVLLHIIRNSREMRRQNTCEFFSLRITSACLVL
jgi:hypothetical protein